MNRSVHEKRFEAGSFCMRAAQKGLGNMLRMRKTSVSYIYSWRADA